MAVRSWDYVQQNTLNELIIEKMRFKCMDMTWYNDVLKSTCEIGDWYYDKQLIQVSLQSDTLSTTLYVANDNYEPFVYIAKSASGDNKVPMIVYPKGFNIINWLTEDNYDNLILLEDKYGITLPDGQF